MLRLEVVYSLLKWQPSSGEHYFQGSGWFSSELIARVQRIKQQAHLIDDPDMEQLGLRRVGLWQLFLTHAARNDNL